MSASAQRYTAVAIVLHWAIAFAILLMIPFGWWMGDQAEDGVVSDGLVMPTTVPRDWVAAQFGFQRKYDGGMSFGGAASATAPLHAFHSLLGRSIELPGVARFFSG